MDGTQEDSEVREEGEKKLQTSSPGGKIKSGRKETVTVRPTRDSLSQAVHARCVKCATAQRLLHLGNHVSKLR